MFLQPMHSQCITSYSLLREVSLTLCVRHTFAPNHTPYIIFVIPSPLHPSPSLVRQQPAMEAAATIIDLRRASARKCKARSRATDAKRAAERIRERTAKARRKNEARRQRRSKKLHNPLLEAVGFRRRRLLSPFSTGALCAICPHATL
jgi:hypothetical protein